MSGDGSHSASVVLPRQTAPQFVHDRLTLGAFLEIDERPDGVHVDLHLYIESQDEKRVLGELRIGKAIFADRNGLKNWLRRLAWNDVMNSLNALRTVSDTDGGYSIKVNSEFGHLMRELSKNL